MPRRTLAFLALVGTGCQAIFGLGDYELAGSGGAGAESSGGSGPLTSTGGSSTTASVSAITTGAGGNGNCCIGISGPELVEVKRTDPTDTESCSLGFKERFGASQAPKPTCSGCTCSHQAGQCDVSGISQDVCLLGQSTNLNRTTSPCTPLSESFAALSNFGGAYLLADCQEGTSARDPIAWTDRYAMCELDGSPLGCEDGTACASTQSGYTKCLLYPNEQTSCPAGFANRTNTYDASGISCACTCDQSCQVLGGQGSCTTPIGSCTSAGTFDHVQVTGPCNPSDVVNGSVVTQTLCCERAL